MVHFFSPEESTDYWWYSSNIVVVVEMKVVEEIFIVDNAYSLPLNSVFVAATTTETTF